LEDVGTDPDRLNIVTALSIKLISQSPISDVVRTHPEYRHGYFAPQLEGIWARFPYLHNASIPNMSAFDSTRDTEVSRVARYIALKGGHRWRALVAVAAGQIFHENAPAIVLAGAAGVELSHAASLILDDLPSMEGAKIRRGRPCAHHVFPKWAVDMVPVYLVTLAYELALSNPLSTAERRVAAAIALSQAGLAMIAGQTSDLSTTRSNCSETQLLDCYRQKSGALYAAATQSGALLCCCSMECAEKLKDVGMWLGLSYQFLDDVADVTAETQVLGKDSNIDGDKVTAVSLYGVEGASAKSNEFQEQALGLLDTYGNEADNLRRLVQQASWAPS